MLNLEMLPAAHGDCLWIEYGDGQQTRRILIDGGPAHTYPALRARILHLPLDARHFELLVITHIDGDHIEGIVRLLQDAESLGCSFARIWFNGYPQLNKVPDPAGAPLGAQQGEMLGLLIAQYEKRIGEKVWNKDLPDGLAMLDRAKALPRITLPGDCQLTLLSPDDTRLLELKTEWDKVLHKSNWKSGDAATVMRALHASRTLKPLGDVLGDEGSEAEDLAGRFEFPDPLGRDQMASPGDTLGGDEDAEPGANAAFGGDTSEANGSSIALLLEFPARQPTVRLLLAGDAWAEVLEASIDQLLTERGGTRLAIDAFKLPHHGSVANISATLLGKLRCARYLVSTSGAIFRHPHARTINLLIEASSARGETQLHFNYLSETTQPWSDSDDQAARKYRAEHPKGMSLNW